MSNPLRAHPAICCTSAQPASSMQSKEPWSRTLAGQARVRVLHAGLLQYGVLCVREAVRGARNPGRQVSAQLLQRRSIRRQLGSACSARLLLLPAVVSVCITMLLVVML